ncbi:AroE2 [Desulforapulum autotrophicum HRM2]|uniref:AroE2 n=2 Tax=Desulforapulum autotrophicum TaxID=2296 RepID=C0QKS6_DESAH|nr:AroE2 [Desulforapulum autotrophicum HRM2]
MFSRVMKRIGIRGVYVPFKVDPGNIGQAMEAMRCLNIDGANIGNPFKESILPHLDVLSEGANIIKAVNTVVRTGSTLKGYNTNAIGFMDTLEKAGFDTAGRNALIFGAEGAAKAVVFILNWLRCERVQIAGRYKKNLDTLLATLEGEAVRLKDISTSPCTANILINASSASSPDEAPKFASIIERLEIKACELVVDLNYGHKNNFWKKLAQSRGIPFIDGLTPLAHAARRTLLLWTKIDVEAGEFIRALESDNREA